MKKKDESASPTGRGVERRRFNSQRKMKAVLRLLRGEELDALSRELGASASTLAGWKEAFLGRGKASLKSRQANTRDEENVQLKALVGDLTLRLEIRRQAERLQAGELPFIPGKRK